MTTSRSNNFYVYFLVDPNTMLPFYVGKGSGKRARSHLWEYKKKVNPYKSHTISKIREGGREPLIVYVVENIADENLAFEIEEKFIALFGTKINNDGFLVNLLVDRVAFKTTERLLAKEHYFNSPKHAEKCRERMLRLHQEGRHPAQLLKESTSLRMREKVRMGIHPFQGSNSPGVIASKARVAAGIHHFQTPEHSARVKAQNKKLSSEGKHNFQTPEAIAALRQRNETSLRDGSHPFKNGAGAASSRRRVANGTHHFLGGEIQKKSFAKRKVKLCLRIQRVDVLTKESIIFESVSEAFRATEGSTRDMMLSFEKRKLPYLGFWWRLLGSLDTPILPPWTDEEISDLLVDTNVYNRLGTVTKRAKKERIYGLEPGV